MLLRCAMRVFARRGLGAARHAEIARAARVSVPTVFFYFPTRKALVSAVLEEVARFFTEMADNGPRQTRARAGAYSGAYARLCGCGRHASRPYARPARMEYRAP